MSDFTVERGQLDRASAAFSSLKSSATSTTHQLQGVGLVQSDFGRVPWLETRVWEAYHDHTTSCLESLNDLVGALGNISAGIAATSSTYRAMDEDAEKAAEYIVASLDAGPE